MASNSGPSFSFKDSKTATVRLDQIRENADSLRPVDRSSAEYLELVDSVRKHGVMSPISVREIKDSDGKVFYGLIDGLHRYNASIDAGATHINVSVGTLEESQLLAAQILANVQKIETKPVEYTKALLKMMAADQSITKTEMCAQLSKSPKWLEDRLSLSKLEPSLAPLVNDSKIVLTNAYALAKLPHEVQLEFKEKAMTESPTVFNKTAGDRQKELAKAKREGRPAVIQFVPQERLHKVAEVKAELEAVRSGAGTLVEALRAANITKPQAAAAYVLEWVLHLDAPTVAKDKAAWEADRAASEEKKKAAQIAREQAKLAELTGTAQPV